MDAELRLAGWLAEAHPDDAARLLEGLPPDRAADVLTALPPEEGARVLERMAAAPAGACLAASPAAERAQISSALADPALARLLRPLPREAARSVLDDLPQGRRGRLARWLAYPEQTAGAWMATDPLALPLELDVSEARRRVLDEPARLRNYAYVTDREHRLVGVVGVRELWSASDDDRLADIMHGPVASVPVRATAEGIASHPGWALYPALPVVDAADVLVGVLTYPTLQQIRADTVRRGQSPFDASPLLVLAELYWEVAAAALDGFLAWADGPRGDRTDG